MKKKTRKMLKKAARAFSELMPGGAKGGGAALTLLAAGGLVAAAARDPELRERGRKLAYAALDRALGLVPRPAQQTMAMREDEDDPESGPESRDWGEARVSEH